MGITLRCFLIIRPGLDMGFGLGENLISPFIDKYRALVEKEMNSPVNETIIPV